MQLSSCNAAKTTMQFPIAHELGWDVYTYLHRLYFESFVLPHLSRETSAIAYKLDSLGQRDDDNPKNDDHTEYLVVARSAKYRRRRDTRLNDAGLKTTSNFHDIADWSIAIQRNSPRYYFGYQPTGTVNM